MTTVADHVISTLQASGITRMYGLPGDSLNGLTDAIRRAEHFSWEHVRHEETAGFAAAADAALTKRLAVCAGSCGPGNLHLINGLFDAQRSRVPVLAIAAHIPQSEIGSQYFQETRPQDLFRECSVYCELVTTAESAPRVLQMAMRAAIEENGVAVVVIPGEIFLHKTGDLRVHPVLPTHSTCRPADDELLRAATILNNSDKITILAGAGVEGAHDELVTLADTLKAPVVHALRGKELVEYDNPYDVGMTGLLGFASGYKAIKEAEVLLMLGTDFPYRQFYPEHATVVQVDIRGRNLGRRTPVDLPLVGSVADTLPALQPLLRTKDDRTHLDRSLRHYRKTRRRLDELAVNDRDKAPIRPEYLAAAADRVAAADAVFTVDVGSPVVWAARYLTMNGRRRLLGSFNHGTMACALPRPPKPGKWPPGAPGSACPMKFSRSAKIRPPPACRPGHGGNVMNGCCNAAETKTSPICCSAINARTRLKRCFIGCAATADRPDWPAWPRRRSFAAYASAVPCWMRVAPPPRPPAAPLTSLGLRTLVIKTSAFNGSATAAF